MARLEIKREGVTMILQQKQVLLTRGQLLHRIAWLHTTVQALGTTLKQRTEKTKDIKQSKP